MNRLKPLILLNRNYTYGQFEFNAVFIHSFKWRVLLVIAVYRLGMWIGLRTQHAPISKSLYFPGFGYVGNSWGGLRFENAKFGSPKRQTNHGFIGSIKMWWFINQVWFQVSSRYYRPTHVIWQVKATLHTLLRIWTMGFGTWFDFPGDKA